MREQEKGKVERTFTDGARTIIPVIQVGICSAILLVSFFFPQPFLFAKHPLKFHRITNENGLSQNTVHCIIQDRKGFMWFGTQDGLNRYDGYRFKVFRHDPENPSTISHNYIRNLYEDKNGYMWVSTWGGGLDRFDPETEIFKHYYTPDLPTSSISHPQCFACCSGGAGVLWVATENGLDRLIPDKAIVEHFVHIPGNPGCLSNNIVLSLLKSRKGTLWVGTANGLNRFNPADNSFRKHFYNPNKTTGISCNHIECLYESLRGDIWIATRGGGLNRYDPISGTFTHYRHYPGDAKSNKYHTGQDTGGNNPGNYFYNDNNQKYNLDSKEISHNRVNTVFEDRQGNIWVGTWGGLDKLNPASNTFTHYHHDPSDAATITHNSVLSIYQDRSGMLWIGTWHGLNKVLPSGKQFHHHLKGSNLTSIVFSIFEAGDDSLWIGTEGGLVHYHPKTKQRKHFLLKPENPNSMSHNTVYCITEDKNGILWLGTEMGLNRIDPKTDRILNYNPSVASRGPGISTDSLHYLSSNRIYGIHRDRNDHLWVSCWERGLFRLSSETGAPVFHIIKNKNPQSLSNNKIYCLLESPDGDFWIGTSSGLNKMNPQTGNCQRYLHTPGKPGSLSNNRVLCMHLSENGILWVGTLGGGLNRLVPETGKFSHFREKDGLSNNSIYGILEDRQGNLWLSTNNGISKFSPPTNTFKNYNTEDGLQDNEFNMLASHKGRSGRFYFGGINGLNAFNPDQIESNPNIPPISITAFRKFNKYFTFNKSIVYTDSVTLSYEDYFFSFEFTALDFQAPEKNRYAYMLEGFDRDWIQTNSQNRIATYTNLDPGGYVFRVKGSNNDGRWNQEGKSIRVIITPPFWRTLWFKVFLSLLVFLLIFAFHRVRIYTIRQKNKQLADSNKILNHQISERLQAEERLQRSENRLRTFLETANDGFVELDYDGLILDLNPKLCEIIGIPRQRLLGSNIIEFIREEDKRTIHNRLRYRKNSKRSTFNLTLYKPDKTPAFCLVSASPLFDGNGKRKGSFAMVTDITDIKKAEDQLRQIQKMETVGNLAGGLAHDFNNVLGGITATVSMLRHDLAKKVSISVEALETDLELIEEASSRATDLVKQLMALSRKQAFSFAPVDLNNAVKHVMKICQNTFDKCIELTTLYYRGEAMTKADPTQMEQVILNLCVNASHAMTIMRDEEEKQGGLLTITIKRINSDEHFRLSHPKAGDGDYWVLRISDTGVGMDSQTVTKIFDPFFTTKKKGIGTGFGLATVFNIVRHHKGFIDVYSEPNIGSTFNIFLPVMGKNEEQPDKRKNPAVPARGSGLILVVDDEKIIRLTARKILTSCGYEVLLAKNGLEGVYLFNEKHQEIKAVIMDLAMPKMSGKEAFVEMKKIDPNVKVLVASGFREDKRIWEMKEMGGKGFIQKPFTMEELSKVLKVIIDGGSL